jgi:hypothetical protein
MTRDERIAKVEWAIRKEMNTSGPYPATAVAAAALHAADATSLSHMTMERIRAAARIRLNSGTVLASIRRILDEEPKS